MSDLPILPPTLQLGFYQRLKDAEKTYLLPALLTHIGSLNIGKLDQELLQFANSEKLAFVARKGLRGELIFPVPYVLETKPALLGYYRLLLGFSQKEIYKGAFSKFKALENGFLSIKVKALLPALCDSLIESSWVLVNGIPELSGEIINSLTLLTLGPQFRGSRNVSLGVEAIRLVFALVKSIATNHIIEEADSYLIIASATSRTYKIEFAPDPDIAIRQSMTNGSYRNRISIEVKGGTDFSNIHNRLGEAEKTHQKAKADGFTQFWTVINVANIDQAIWKQETPTTNEVFYLEQIIDPRHAEHARFREYLISELGI
ncbi:MAG: XcyI family restriction endonuclease [Anaerolineales bacterium]